MAFPIDLGLVTVSCGRGDVMRIVLPQARLHAAVKECQIAWLATPSATLYNGGILAYEVRGSLKRLPTDHIIWLLTQYEGDRRVRPHGFDPVKYNKDTGEWHGWINGKNFSRAKIIVVVAPPSSHDLFSYYQAPGRETNWADLTRLPPECKNKAEVDAGLQP